MDVTSVDDGPRGPAIRPRTLYGRDAERVQLDETIGRGGLVTLTGRGGVGKSALALDAAGRAKGRGEQVLVVPLEAVVDADAVLDEVCDAVGVRTGGDDPLAILVRRFSRIPTLLVLDNAEHLLGAGPAVARLVGLVESLTVLTTSQRRLGVSGEHTMAVLPLPVPDPSSTGPDDIAATPSVALYLDREASVVGPHAARPELADVAELCRRLEGLPLAIELAAARAATIGAREIVAWDEGPLIDVLRGGPSDAPARHRALRDTIAWSVGLLAPRARHLLRSLAVLHCPFDLDLATAVAGTSSSADVLDDLSTLVDLHLVDPDGTGSFTLPPSIRGFAEEELDAAERVAAADRVLEWCSTDVEDRTTSQLCEAVRMAAARDRAETAHRLLLHLGERWTHTRMRQDHRTLVEDAIAAPSDAEVDEGLRGRALVLSVAMAPPVSTGPQRERFVARLAAAEEIARRRGDDDLLLQVIGTRMRASSALGPVDGIDEVIAEAAAATARLGDDTWRARVALWAGVVAQGRLDLAAAAAHGRVALRIGLALPDDALVAHASLFLAPLVPHVAGLAAEVPTLDDVLTSVRRAGLTSSETYVLPMLVDDLIAEGDLDRATELAIAAFDLLADAPDSAATVPNLVVAINLCVALGEDDQGAFLLGALGSSAAMVLAMAPPQNRARHAAAVATIEGRHGSSIGRPRGAGATADRATAVESTLRILLRHRAAAEAAASVALTPREREVLGLLAEGMTNKEIGVELGLRPKTVMHHTTAIYRKLGVRGRSEAVVLALRRGLTVL